MLLVDKTANKVTRQDDEDVAQSLHLPLACLSHHDHSLRIQVSYYFGFGPKLAYQSLIKLGSE